MKSTDCCSLIKQFLILIPVVFKEEKVRIKNWTKFANKLRIVILTGTVKKEFLYNFSQISKAIHLIANFTKQSIFRYLESLILRTVFLLVKRFPVIFLWQERPSFIKDS